jgi:hypothetical protein
MHSGQLHNLAENMVGQESAGLLGGLILRLARYLGGDPAAPVSVASAGTPNTAALPDNTTAESALLQVQGAAILYRTDGQDPAVAGGVSVVVGSMLTLTGKPTLRAFRFVSASAATATLAGSYFD